MSRTRQPWDFTKFLGEALKTNPQWKLLFDKTSSVMKDLIEERVDQLVRSRQPFHIQRGDYVATDQGRGLVSQVVRQGIEDTIDNSSVVDKVYVEINNNLIEIPMRALHDRNVLIDGSKFAGFDYFSDSFSDDDYGRVYQFINEYWPTSGTEDFANFMGFIKRMRLDVHQLWTLDLGDDASGENPALDYYPFLERQDPLTMIPVFDDLEGVPGKYYPTSHVELEFDYFLSPNPDFTDLINLFYYMAPIHLVLHRIVAAANAVRINTYQATIAQEHIYENTRYTWSADAKITKYGGFATQIHIYEAGQLNLTPLVL